LRTKYKNYNIVKFKKEMSEAYTFSIL